MPNSPDRAVIRHIKCSMVEEMGLEVSGSVICRVSDKSFVLIYSVKWESKLRMSSDSLKTIY